MAVEGRRLDAQLPRQPSQRQPLQAHVVQQHQRGLHDAYLDGEEVVNVRAGTAGRGTGRPVEERTLFNAWSAGKSAASTVVHVLAERGLLDYGTPVAEYWPDFAANGKRASALEHVLTHSAGLPQAPPGLRAADLAGWDGMCARIAAVRPLWETGTVTGYHALTFGYILGEVVRRVTGRPIAQVLREEVAGLPCPDGRPRPCPGCARPPGGSATSSACPRWGRGSAAREVAAASASPTPYAASRSP